MTNPKTAQWVRRHGASGLGKENGGLCSDSILCLKVGQGMKRIGYDQMIQMCSLNKINLRCHKIKKIHTRFSYDYQNLS